MSKFNKIIKSYEFITYSDLFTDCCVSQSCLNVVLRQFSQVHYQFSFIEAKLIFPSCFSPSYAL